MNDPDNPFDFRSDDLAPARGIIHGIAFTLASALVIIAAIYAAPLIFHRPVQVQQEAAQ